MPNPLELRKVIHILAMCLMSENSEAPSTQNDFTIQQSFTRTRTVLPLLCHSHHIFLASCPSPFTLHFSLKEKMIESW